MKRKTRLTIETERVTIIRRGRVVHQATCEACGEVVPLVTVEEAAAMARVSMRTIYQLIVTDQLHCTETAEGIVLVCFTSLRRSL